MFGFQSVSQPVKSSQPRKHFTLAEANRSLPLVRRIVADIVRVHEELGRTNASCQSASPGRELQAMQSQLAAQYDRLQQFIDELHDLGVELKDYQMGLIDFVARHQGRDVYLCWRLGEEQVAYWHEMQAGFAGRQPVSTLQET